MSCFVLIFNKSKKLNREKHYFWLKLHLSSNNIAKCKNNTAKTPFLFIKLAVLKIYILQIIPKEYSGYVDYLWIFIGIFWPRELTLDIYRNILATWIISGYL